MLESTPTLSFFFSLLNHLKVAQCVGVFRGFGLQPAMSSKSIEIKNNFFFRLLFSPFRKFSKPASLLREQCDDSSSRMLHTFIVAAESLCFATNAKEVNLKDACDDKKSERRYGVNMESNETRNQ